VLERAMDNNVKGNIAFTVDGMGNGRPKQFGVTFLPFATKFIRPLLIIVSALFVKDRAFNRTICISFLIEIDKGHDITSRCRGWRENANLNVTSGRTFNIYS
jgi:hypothetical protein